MKKHRLYALLPTFVMIAWLVFVTPIHADGTSMEINGTIGGDRTTETETAEDLAPTPPSEDVASPNEDKIILGQFPNTGEHKFYLLAFIGLGLLLLFALASARKNKEY